MHHPCLTKITINLAALKNVYLLNNIDETFVSFVFSARVINSVASTVIESKLLTWMSCDP